MPSEIWQRLGMDGPTADLLSIKKAYAARLKKTRPDDDPEAYQALRQAYEWSLQWATRQADPVAQQSPPEHPHEASPEPAAETSLARSDSAVNEVSPQVTAPTTELSPVAVKTDNAKPQEQELITTPESLVAQTHEVWRHQGEAALLLHWPTLRQSLDDLPLTALPEASARLADFVLHEPELPERWLIEVDRHFGWRDDFRTARLIGPYRAQALVQALNDRIVRPITDPSVLATLEPLLRLARLVRNGRGQVALLFAALSGGTLQALYGALPPRQWRAMGFEAATQTSVRGLMNRAGVLRLAMLFTLLGGTMLTLGRSVFETVSILALVGIASFFLFGVVTWVHGVMAGWFGLRHRDNAMARKLRAWYEHPNRGRVGLLLLVSSLVAAVASNARVTNLEALIGLVWLIATVLAAVVLWPQDLRRGAVVLSAALIGLMMDADAKAPITFSRLAELSEQEISLALAWGLIANLAYDAGWFDARRNSWFAKPQVWPFAPIVNTLSLGERWGYSFALTTVPVLVCLALANFVRPTSLGLFTAWTLLTLAFGLVQSQLFKAGEWLADRWRL